MRKYRRFSDFAQTKLLLFLHNIFHLTMQYRWQIQQLSKDEKQICQNLSTELKISEEAAVLLVNRGLTTASAARDFIRPTLDKLHDPLLMKDMDRAIERVILALQNNERILIYGDYDVDGTTAVALTYRYLNYIEHIYLKRSQTAIDFYIPDRYKEGYGISYQGIDYGKNSNCSLVIALDCGIRSGEKIKYAKDIGIDFIICDHHLPGENIPECIAVLDAKRKDNTYPFNELSGCGVGFKLMQGLQQTLHLPQESLLQLLELTAMSIASDIVPVIGENRILAANGLRYINKSPSLGLKYLMQVATLSNKEIVFDDLIYRIGPRLNACGRIDSGRSAVKLLITSDENEAFELSHNIDDNNQIRKNLDQQITTEAIKQLNSDTENSNKFSTVIKGRGWHRGVIGIVASRLIEHYYRPTIIFSESEDGILTGSARSVTGFDIYTAIDSCSDLLIHFGGHVFAAGLTMRTEFFNEFSTRFEQYVRTHILPQQKEPILKIETIKKITTPNDIFVSLPN